MSQATFDPTTPGGPSDDTGETHTRTGQSARRRPSRRGHAASAKAAAEATAQPTTQPATQTTPEPESATPMSAATPSATPASAATPATPATAPAADEAGARAEGHSRRSRGGAKRAAPRGKVGAQLIIPKTGDESQPEGAQAPQPAMPAAEQASEAPVIVPVVTSAHATPTETAAPAAEPRKLRFGLPKRFRLPDVTIATSTEPASFAQPAQSAAETSAEPAAEVAQPAPAEAPARYRFDRSRRTTVPGAAGVRPERLGAQATSLYTGPEAATPANASATAATNAPANAATEQLFDLPPLESLVSRGSDLPTLAFDEPAMQASAATADEAEALDDGGEAADLAEGAGASSRRRRRRRRSVPAHNGAHGAEADESAEDDGQPTPSDDALEALYDEEPPVAPSEPVYEAPHEARPAYEEPTPQRGRNGRYGYSGRTLRRAPAEPTWEAPTQQQPAAAEASPYGSPEPAFARGFGPTPNGAATPVRESYPRPSRTERGGDATAASVAQLGSVLREAINAQTDRLLTELRHQQPPAVTLSIPNAQTTERIAVFVDVPNVIYSARGLRTSVDFGRLLDFLRANRRLARAQAYAPTDPTPGAEQSFLSAVKGLGYRITTKNYKTFSNGAKKADLDLDLCMDIVRIVEAKAVDTIVLVSGDSDFLPLLEYCTDHGVRVEVAAFDDAASMILRQSCDLFVNLSLVDGIRG